MPSGWACRVGLWGGWGCVARAGGGRAHGGSCRRACEASVIAVLGADLLEGDMWKEAKRSLGPEYQALLQETMQMVLGSRAASSLQQYQAPWERFVRFCKTVGQQYCPPAPWVVAVFLHVAAKSAASYAPVKAASAAISTHLELRGVEERPTKSPICKAVRAAAKRRLGAAVQRRKEPLTVEVLVPIVEVLAPTGAPLHNLMLATYVMVSYAGFLRFNDTVQLRVKHVRLFEDMAELFLLGRKNDQFREGTVVKLAAGQTVVCPVALLRRFLAEAGWAGESPLFRDYDGHAARAGRPAVFKEAAAPHETMRGLVHRWLAKVLGLPEAEVKQSFGLHSLRSGGASAAAAGPVEERLLQARRG
jgi:integrase